MKEYTVLAFFACVVTIVLDVVLGTRVTTRRLFWIFLAVMFGFKFLVNGYLTWRPIVLYGKQFFLDVRIWTIPVEDFLYGFSLIAVSVILWEYFSRPRTNESN